MFVSKPTVLKSTCLVFVKYFPFDVQACKLKFGSWTYNSLQLNLTSQSEEPVLTGFVVNEQWDLELALTREHVVKYDCCPEKYPDVTFYLCIRRKPLYYIYNLITPCILLCGLSFLGFFMPYNVGVVKANLSVTLILSLTVFLLLVAQMMPRTSMEIPLIGQYYLAAMSLISVSTAMNIAVLNVNVCNREVPRWVQVIVLKYLAVVCFQNCSCAIEPTPKPKKLPRDIASGMIRLRPSPLIGRRSTSSSACEHDANYSPARTVGQLSRSMRNFRDVNDIDVDMHFGKMESYVEQIFRHLKAVQRKNDKKSALREEWVKVATILDKLLLVLFSIATITTTLSLLLQTPGADTQTLCHNIIDNVLDKNLN
ncbi:neuronal acetylcholine receptor subunit alpha-9-like [Ptychodera flava]|uniref:neuronal acetylcholine receptor subunit alpha-9-like n=1 Tax=Ptychodera flava TaxID=63121 RepID=UPI00396A8736